MRVLFFNAMAFTGEGAAASTTAAQAASGSSTSTSAPGASGTFASFSRRELGLEQGLSQHWEEGEATGSFSRLSERSAKKQHSLRPQQCSLRPQQCSLRPQQHIVHSWQSPYSKRTAAVRKPFCYHPRATLPYSLLHSRDTRILTLKNKCF